MIDLFIGKSSSLMLENIQQNKPENLERRKEFWVPQKAIQG